MGEVLVALLSYVLPALIAGGASLWNNKKNVELQEETNTANREYADAMTTAQWERDDTSFQRQVADAKSAGLSPLAVTGYAPSSTPVTSMAQAPQMDLSSLIGAISSMSAIGDFYNKSQDRKINQSQFDRKIKLETYQAEQSLYEFEKDLEQRNIEHKEQCQQFLDSLQYQYDVLNMEIEKANASGNQSLEEANLNRIADLSKSSMDFYSNYCSVLGVTPKFRFYDDIDTYLNALNEFSMNWNPDMGPDVISENSSENHSSSRNTNYGGAGVLGFNVNLPGTGGSVANSTSEGKTVDNTRVNTIKALPNTPFPIFKPKSVKGKGDSIKNTNYKPRKRAS